MGISGLGDDMAEYEKKLKVKIAGGTVQDIKIYSDEADIPPWQKPLRTKFEGTFEGWVPTSPLGSPDASALRVRHPDSDEIYVVNTIGRAAAGSTMVRTVGVVEFTVPAGVRKLKVTLVGGGSSGNGTRYGVNSNGESCVGNAGQGSWFAHLTISGGASPGVGEGPKWPVAQNGYFIEYGMAAGSTRIVETDQFGSTERIFGSGVGYGGSSSSVFYGRSGLRGGIASAFIDVSPGQVVSGHVGAGGAGVHGYYRTSGGGDTYIMESWVGDGASGCIYIEWGGSIE